MPTRFLAIFTIFFSVFSEASTPPLKSLTGKDAVEEFSVSTQKVKTLVPRGWEPVSGVLNTPLALLSEKGKQDLRTVIQIVPYGQKDNNNELAKIKKDTEEFYAQKEEWLEGMGGQSTLYLPLTETTRDGTTVISIGIKYKNAAGQFIDKSWYLSTKNKELFYVKAVIPADLEWAHGSQVNQVITSIVNQN